jgi:hypothetical protein
MSATDGSAITTQPEPVQTPTNANAICPTHKCPRDKCALVMNPMVGGVARVPYILKNGTPTEKCFACTCCPLNTAMAGVCCGLASGCFAIGFIPWCYGQSSKSNICCSTALSIVNCDDPHALEKATPDNAASV